MTKSEKIIQRILASKTGSSIKFSELLTLVKLLGFSERIKGSHHIFYKDGIDEILNFQPDGHLAKPYQVRQLRDIILKYDLEQKK